MKFSCEKTQLLAAIVVSGKVASSKSTVAALEGLLLDAGEMLSITGYDLKTGIQTKVPAQVDVPGKIVLNARLFGEIIRKLPEDVVSVEVDDNYMANITCGQSKFHVMGIAAEDYPALPLVDEENSFYMPQKTLKQMIAQTIFAISDNESRPIHTGSLFEVEENTLTIVSVDGYRLALRRETLEQITLTEKSFVVPGTALNEVEKIATDSDDELKISIDSKHILFTIGDIIVVSRRLEGEFLNYKQAIPQTNKIALTVDKRLFINAVDRVSLMISEKLKSPVRCLFLDGKVELHTNTALGKANDMFNVKGDGENLEIGFNHRFLLEALKATPTDEITISLGTSVSPCVIHAVDGSDAFTYLVLPVRLQAGA